MQIHQRDDGRYFVEIPVGRGKKHYISAKSKDALNEKIAEAQIRLKQGLSLSSAKGSFESWGLRWLKRQETRVSENWYKVQVYAFKKLEPLYAFPVEDLHAIDLEEVLDDIANKGYSAEEIKKVRNIAVSVLRMCVDNRVIPYNSFESVQSPRSRYICKERRALTSEEQKWIVETPHRAQTAAMIMLYAGLRRGELLALEWSDIDLNAHTIRVDKTVVMHNGRPEIKQGGKTDSATRTVYIPQQLVNYLARQKHPFTYVVTKLDGSLMTDCAWKRMWNSYLNDLNCKYGFDQPVNKNRPGGVPFVIPKFTAHWLRHTFITLMYLSGIDVLTAAEQAGHSDPKVTMEIYTHLSAEFKKKNITKLEEYLNNI